MSIFNELKRRNVFRVGLAYVVAAWVIAQVSDLVLDNIDAPPWVMQALLLGLGLGFIVALIIAWAYELTPEGIKKEKDVARDDSITNMTAKKLDYITLAGVLLVVVLFVYQKINPTTLHNTPIQAGNHSEAAGTDSNLRGNGDDDGVTNKIFDKSIAVLPFVNMSSDKEQDYFSDGITEEILNALAKIKQLKVAGRTSSFSFKGKNEDLRIIGDALGVAHILEGSVRKAGTQVRITAQLIKVEDGFHMWSETYDGSLDNVFDLQEKISRHVTDELKLVLKINDNARLASKMTGNIDAYDLFLRGRKHVRLRLDDNIPKGIALLEQAVELDPQFAEAWAMLAEAEAVSDSYILTDHDLSVERANAHIKTAKALDPTLVSAYAVSGLIKSFSVDADYLGGIKELQQALSIEPNNPITLRWLANVYQTLGYFDKALPLYEKALLLDPLSWTEACNLGYNKLNTGDLVAAIQYLDQCDSLVGHLNNIDTAFAMAAQGNQQAAIDHYMKLHEQDVNRLGADAMNSTEDAKRFIQAVVSNDKKLLKTAQASGKIHSSGPDDESYWQLSSIIALENFDRAFQILEDHPEFFAGFGQDNLWNQFPDSKDFRKDPRFAPMLLRFGVPQVWQKLGWPDICQPNAGTDGSNGQFQCQ